MVVDLGYRGVDADNPGVQILHRGKFKRMTLEQRRWLRRRQAIEPAIGHMKADHRMDRCWLPGASGDALHALSCALGYNIRWLMRALQAKARRALLCLLQRVASGGEQAMGALRAKLNGLAGMLRMALAWTPLGQAGGHVASAAG